MASLIGLALSNDAISFSVARSVPALRTEIYGNIEMEIFWSKVHFRSFCPYSRLLTAHMHSARKSKCVRHG